MKYRKRLPIVEAFRWEGRVDRAPEWFRKVYDMGDAAPTLHGECIVTTRGGRMAAYLGDWIIQGEEGDLRTCDGETFERLYDPIVDEEEPR